MVPTHGVSCGTSDMVLCSRGIRIQLQAQQRTFCCDQVIVDFTAQWCGPCRTIGPYFDQLAPEFPNVKFIKVDVDALEVRHLRHYSLDTPHLFNMRICLLVVCRVTDGCVPACASAVLLSMTQSKQNVGLGWASWSLHGVCLHVWYWLVATFRTLAVGLQNLLRPSTSGCS